MSLVAVDLRDLETRVCATPACPRDADAGSDRCRVHASRSGELVGLAERAVSEHRAAGQTLSESIQHAIRCGEALLAAHALITNIPDVNFGDWLTANVGISNRYAYGYMRLSVHRDALPPEAFAPYLDGRGRRRDPSLSRALDFAAHLPAIADKNAQWRIPAAKRDEIVRLHQAGGLSYAEIGRRTGVHHVTVARIVDPTLDQRKRAATNQKKRNATATSRAAAGAALEQRLAAALAAHPDLAEPYRSARNLVDELADDAALAKPYRHARAARNALIEILLEGAPT